MSHLDCCLLVIFVLDQAASPQHKITLVPVLDQTPLLFLEPAGLQGPLHGPGGAHGAGARVPLSWYHTLGPSWNKTKLCLVKMSREDLLNRALPPFNMSMGTEKIGGGAAAHVLLLV